jgi:hypothetical protein
MDALKEIVSTLAGLLLVFGAFMWVAGRHRDPPMDN